MHQFGKTWMLLLLGAKILGLTFAWGEELFPVGPTVQKQIDFWKKIYTEIHDNEGLIHDSEDLTLIYQKLQIPASLGPRQQQKYVDQAKRQIESLLNSIAHKGGTQLTAAEEEMYGQLGRPRPELLKTLGPRMRYQRGQREKFYQGLRQSQLYLPHIQRILAAWGVPQDLAFLPHVESSFNFLAYSKVGAAGIWQFMRDSARHYRLKINDLFDERRDPLKSTVAAARMLKFNYQKLGSWPLAITAYNHGVNSIMRAVNQVANPHFENIARHYRNKRFGFASKNFYPCFMAAREIALAPEKYFPELKHAAPLRPLQVIQVGRPYTLKEVMRIAGIGQRELMRLNPGLKAAAFAPDAILPGRDALILPGDIDFGAPQIAQLRLPGLGPAAAVAAAPSPSPAPPRDKAISPPRRATLWPSRLAAWWQAMKNYFGHSPTQGPRPQQSTVAAASPPTPPPSSQVWQAVAQDNSLVTKKFNLAGTRLANGLYQIQVQPAETLGHYRDWSEVDLAVLQKLNHLKGTQIGLGQKLVLPLSAAQITRFEQRRQSHHQVLREDFLAKYRLAGLQEYVVQAGDTLNKILAHFSLSLWPLKLLMPDEWNGQIYPGQKLLLPQLKGRP